MLIKKLLSFPRLLLLFPSPFLPPPPLTFVLLNKPLLLIVLYQRLCFYFYFELFTVGMLYYCLDLNKVTQRNMWSLLCICFLNKNNIVEWCGREYILYTVPRNTIYL